MELIALLSKVHAIITPENKALFKRFLLKLLELSSSEANVLLRDTLRWGVEGKADTDRPPPTEPISYEWKKDGD